MGRGTSCDALRRHVHGQIRVAEERVDEDSDIFHLGQIFILLRELLKEE